MRWSEVSSSVIVRTSAVGFVKNLSEGKKNAVNQNKLSAFSLKEHFSVAKILPTDKYLVQPHKQGPEQCKTIYEKNLFNKYC